LVKKSRDDFQDRLDEFVTPFLPDVVPYTADAMINESGSPEELNSKLNEVDHFISLDTETHHLVLASLAGCKSVVVPKLGISAREFYSTHPLQSNGVAYGFDELSHQAATLQNLVESNHLTGAKNQVNLEDFLALCSERFCRSPWPRFFQDRAPLK
jgi:hypothetical protein